MKEQLTLINGTVITIDKSLISDGLVGVRTAETTNDDGTTSATVEITDVR